jgi:hypothetical protein
MSEKKLNERLGRWKIGQSSKLNPLVHRTPRQFSSICGESCAGTGEPGALARLSHRPLS